MLLKGAMKSLPQIKQTLCTFLALLSPSSDDQTLCSRTTWSSCVSRFLFSLSHTLAALTWKKSLQLMREMKEESVFNENYINVHFHWGLNKAKK